MAAECASNADALMIEKEKYVKLAHEMKSLQIKSVLNDMVDDAERTSWRKTETILNERVTYKYNSYLPVTDSFLQINQLNIAITNYEAQDQKTRDENITRLNAEVAKLNAEIAKLAAEATHWSRAHVSLLCCELELVLTVVITERAL